MSFVLTTLAADAGVLISLRSQTVQEATQTLAAAFLIPPMLLMMALPAFHHQLKSVLGDLSGGQLLTVFVAVLILADPAVHAPVLARFRRQGLLFG